MTRDLEQKVALVTGGGRGIGKAIATGLAERGANVVVSYLRKREVAEETCRELEGHGVKTVAIRANAGDAAQVDALFEQIDEIFGRLDVFVSNAATGVIDDVARLDDRAWQWTMNANARAFFHGTQRAAALMPAGGRVLALSSNGAQRVLPGYSIVGASKAAIESLCRYLAVELAPRGVTVNVISPGVVDTDALKHFAERDRILREARERTPVGRIVEPRDVAAVADFLTSDAAAMVTGQIVVVDGGASLLA